jgi:hypothetical protein
MASKCMQMLSVIVKTFNLNVEKVVRLHSKSSSSDSSISITGKTESKAGLSKESLHSKD